MTLNQGDLVGLNSMYVEFRSRHCLLPIPIVLFNFPVMLALCKQRCYRVTFRECKLISTTETSMFKIA